MKTRSEILDEFRDCIGAYRKAKERCSMISETGMKLANGIMRRIEIAELKGKINAFEFVLGMKVKDIEQ